MKTGDRVQTSCGGGTVVGFEYRGAHFERAIVKLDDPSRCLAADPAAFFRSEVQQEAQG